MIFDQYTDVFVHKGKIYARGYKNKKLVERVLDYKPYLFFKSQTPSEYSTIHNELVSRMDFDSIYDAKDYIKKYKDVENMPIYGMQDFEYSWIYDNFPGELNYDPSIISVVAFDIETTMENPIDLENTPNEVTAITLSKKGHKYCLSTIDFPEKENVTYFKCKNEKDLLEKFILVWKKLNPDIITGWNIDMFDIPYIIHRIEKILGEGKAKELSPWGRLQPKIIEYKGEDVRSFDIKGVVSYDYLALYKKFTYEQQESYSLDHIAFVELEENKLDYSEYEDLDDLWNKNPIKYIEYNIHDVTLIDKLEEKMKLIELGITMAYDAKCNLSDVFGTVVYWDVVIHHYLLDKKKVIPPKKNSIKREIVGGFVKEVIPGKHRWVVGFDLTGLYPHLIMSLNIGPETHIDKILVPSVDEVVEGERYPDSVYSCAANGCRYTRDFQGFLAALMEKTYGDRKIAKKKMLEAEKEHQKTKESYLINIIAKYNNLQLAKKIAGNSAYGALLNAWFRWYDDDNGEAITMSGQLAAKWIHRKLNDYMKKLTGIEKDWVVAGDTDSVVGDSLIYVDGKKIKIEEFYNSIEDDFIKKDDFNKDYVKVVRNKKSYSVSKYSQLEEKNIKYVMKHTVKKVMYRIKCNGNFVDVTADHSIIVKNKKTGKMSSIKPENLNPKLHKIININAGDTDRGVYEKEETIL